MTFSYNSFEDRVFECFHHTLSISPLLSGLMRGILRFIFFICKHKKLLSFLRLLVGVWVCYCLILEFCFLQNCQYAKIVNYYSDILEESTRSCICCRHTACGSPTFFCARKKFMGKTFLTFYFETCSDTGIIFCL